MPPGARADSPYVRAFFYSWYHFAAAKETR
ncbi:MAG: hypothetical protein GF344_11550 [Chitinivibrionales bacterium]|nr:hypothetical protein [Chitinivibrionales bacterium]